ncbi:hypothetical protein U14_05007 [Candidatus Moduliflexus flocculans]|uniref:Uncharacterized protein n=1 Tax=Candidatus Moduliflexus flocculans TaxID=1499966 RepID=A0A081BQQ2_9BACT|nr:hypothetical protein U14_05007 [Candidatus Moduliflexus flocculans]
MAILYGHAVKIDWLGADHTYVTSSDGGKWGCWGGCDGGEVICSGTGSSKQANCLSQNSSHAGLIYAVTGVCHQTANRILSPAKVIVREARGYWASVILYGTYGTSGVLQFIEWKIRQMSCRKQGGDFAPGMSELALSPDPMLADYLNRVEAIYANAIEKKTIAEFDADENAECLAQELEAMADYRLGAAKNAAHITDLQKRQKQLLHEKKVLDVKLIGKDISAAAYAEEIHCLVMTFMKENAALLGETVYNQLLGMPSDSDFQLIDANILSMYHPR